VQAENRRRLSLTMGGLALPARLLAQTPDEPVHDRAIIDTWAQALGMTGWHRWHPCRMLT
jgi:hypothetical protein